MSVSLLSSSRFTVDPRQRRAVGGGGGVDGRAFVAAIADRRAAASRRTQPAVAPAAGLRFAFYGRMSTTGFQDVATSRAWQRAVCDELINGVGTVVVEFFDDGVSRRWS
jgi:hypothetical protein